MDASRLLTPFLGAALAAVLLLPAAAAHTTVFSDDGKYRIVVGQLEEPVITRQKTGLDLCFTLNTTAREPVAIDLDAFEDPEGSVTLVAPDGQGLSMPLRQQFGRAGCYQFEEPYVLTQPGQYTVALEGDINGTAIAITGINAGGAVIEQGDILFPDEQGAPLPVAAWLMAGLVALAALRRMRA